MALTVYEIDGMAHVGLLHHMNELGGFDGLTSKDLSRGHWWIAQDTDTFEAVGFACRTEDLSRLFVLARCAGQGLETQFAECMGQKAVALGLE